MDYEMSASNMLDYVLVLNEHELRSSMDFQAERAKLGEKNQRVQKLR